MKEETIFNLYSRATFDSKVADGVPFDMILTTFCVDNLQDGDLIDPNKFFECLFKYLDPSYSATYELLYIEIITDPVIEHKMFDGLSVIKPSMYEPAWMQNKHIFFFKDWKRVDESVPLIANNSSGIALIENKFNKGDFYMVCTESGFNRSNSLADIQAQYAQYKESPSLNMGIYAVTNFLQIRAIVFYDKKQDVFYSLPFSTLRKLTFRQKFNILKYNKFFKNSLYGVVPLWQQWQMFRNILALRLKITVTSRNSEAVILPLLAFLSTVFYAYIIYRVFR